MLIFNINYLFLELSSLEYLSLVKYSTDLPFESLGVVLSILELLSTSESSKVSLSIMSKAENSRILYNLPVRFRPDLLSAAPFDPSLVSVI